MNRCVLRNTPYNRWLRSFFACCLIWCLSAGNVVSAQADTSWVGYTSVWGNPESRLYPSTIFRDGYMTIPKSLVKYDHPYYFSHFLFKDTFCITNNFSFECRVKDVEDKKRINSYDFGIRLLGSTGNSSGCTLSSDKLDQKHTSAFSGSDMVYNKPQLIVNLKEWTIVRLEYRNNVLHYLINGKEIFALPYKRNVCNIIGIFFTFKGIGLVDWVRIFDGSGAEVYREDFSDHKKITHFPICDRTPLQVKLEYLPPACKSNKLQLMASANKTASFSWTGPNSFVSKENAPVINNPGLWDTGVYRVAARINECLVETVSFMDVSFAGPSQKSIAIDTTVCNGGSVYGYSKSGVYTDILTAENGCDSVRVLHLNVRDPLVTGLPRQLSLCPGDSVVLKPVTNFDTYKWQNGSEQSGFSVSKVGKYWVSVGRDGCIASDTIWVSDDGACSDINIPNAFSPNGDGINDLWKIPGIDMAKLSIFNRVGQLVYSQEGTAIVWDGKFKGVDLPMGTYYYIYNRKLNSIWRRQSGSVTILR